MQDLIILQDNELDDIFDIVNSYQIIFHSYYFKEGKFEHYSDFLRDRKDKIIILDRNMSSMIFDYFSKGNLNSENDMILVLIFLLFCNINRFQYNIGLAMCEYADNKENDEVIKQLNKLLTYLSEIPTMVLKDKLITGNYDFKPFDIQNKFNRYTNYKIKSDLYLTSYCSTLKIVEIFLTVTSAKERIIKYLDWFYDNLLLSMYDITYAILLFTNYPSIKAPKSIKSKDFNYVIKGCKNQAWDLAYLSSLNNVQHQFSDKEFFFATNDKNLKLIFIACHFFENLWCDLIRDRLSKKDSNEVIELIENKMDDRVKPVINKEILTNLSLDLENQLRKIV